jgi:hypothetical protein
VTGRAERRRFLDDVRPVLWESTHDTTVDGALWTGYTDNYLRVVAAIPQHVDLNNIITPTRLDELHGDDLFGTPLIATA